MSSEAQPWSSLFGRICVLFAFHSLTYGDKEPAVEWLLHKAFIFSVFSYTVWSWHGLFWSWNHCAFSIADNYKILDLEDFRSHARSYFSEFFMPAGFLLYASLNNVKWILVLLCTDISTISKCLPYIPEIGLFSWCDSGFTDIGTVHNNLWHMPFVQLHMLPGFQNFTQPIYWHKCIFWHHFIGMNLLHLRR